MTKSAHEQQQFLHVIDRDRAEQLWRQAFTIDLEHGGDEEVALPDAWGRVLARDVIAEIDVPFFDRSNLDGFAVRAEDTYGADEERPVELRLLDEVIATAMVPRSEVRRGEAIAIATGGMLPRGADAIVMVEHTETVGALTKVFKSVTPGRGVTFAGTDLARGEIVYRRGDVLTSRETGVLAAIGMHHVAVRRRPRVAIISTGDEIIAPTAIMKPGLVFDSNAQVLADAVRELGGIPIRYGIVADQAVELRRILREALASCDLVLLSGGTSKGAGDISYEVVREFDDPGIVAHGVALKPGKPICLAATQGKPLVVLPGFPTSAIFTFHEFVASVILQMSGRPPQNPQRVPAEIALRVNSDVGRTEFLLVGLVQRSSGELAAYPMGKGSGSVTTFARADGFVTIDRHQEILEEASPVMVTLLGGGLQIADFVVLGSHCVGVDFLLGELQKRGFRTKFLAVGSTAGLRAVERGECDVAGIHLLDPRTQAYNRPFLSDGLELLAGYQRQQGIVFRRDDARFLGKAWPELAAETIRAPDCVMVNRNQGSGTRLLIDGLLGGFQPNGYAVQSRSHNAVAASVAQGRSDWGIAIEEVAKQNGLGFLPMCVEDYDFVFRKESVSQATEAFGNLLREEGIRAHLRSLGLIPN